MSKSILQSIKPQRCELIASGKKTIEVRKTRPKIQTPFKVYIYCTKDKLLTKSHNNGNIYLSENKYKLALEKAGNLTLSGKVIGEYVCDYIEEYKFLPIDIPWEEEWDYTTDDGPITMAKLTQLCLYIQDLYEYGKGKTLYGWHISDLKIYDKPKELDEFRKSCEYNIDGNCYLKETNFCEHQKTNEWFATRICNNILTRPPQSWCYVEEV